MHQAQQERPMAGVARETQIHEAYTRVEAITRDLEQLIGQAEDRFTACLSPAKLIAEGPRNPTPQPVRAPLANGLTTLADTLDNVRDRMRALIGRCEL
jgi:hypothetical protein